MSELQFVQLGVLAAKCYQFFVVAKLGDLALGYDGDAVSVLDGGETVGDYYGGSALSKLVQ